MRPRSLAAVGLAAMCGAVIPAAAAFASFGASRSNSHNSISGATISAVTGVQATVLSSTSIKVSWVAPTQTVDNVSYEVLDTTNSSTVCTSPATTDCTDTSVFPGQSYSFTVRAFVASTSWRSDATTSASTPDAYALSPSTTQTAGSSFNLTVTAKKATSATNSTLVADTSYTASSVTFSGPAASPAGNKPSYGGTTGTSDTSVTLTGTTFTNGSLTTPVTLFNAGSNTITATTGSGGSAVTGSDTLTVSPVAAKTLSVTGLANATAGTAQSATVSAIDQYGNTATGYRGTIGFTSTDSQATAGSGLPSNYTFVAGDNGTHTFGNGVTLKTAGSQTVTATDTATATIKGAQTVTVTAAGPNSLLFVQCSKNGGAAGSCSNVTVGNGGNVAGQVEALDVYGNAATITSSFQVTITSSNSLWTVSNSPVTISSAANPSTGTAWKVTYNGTGASSTTITATDASDSSITGTMTASK